VAPIRTDVPLRESLADLRWSGPDEPTLAGLAHRWGDTNLLDRALARAKRAL
jgi:hypothetical protein